MAKLPEIIGPYRILEELGHGGSATVYLAQIKDSDSVALKVLNPAAVRDPNVIKRFEREASTITRLNHPNIIRIFDTKRSEEILFIAMECIPGGTLRMRLDKGPLPMKEAVHIVTQIGAALTYAHTHESEIVHRDLKPENILLDTDKDPVRSILTDFGLVKLLSADGVTPLTQTGDVMGSYPYMAPEQWNNDSLTPLTDLYALAIIFFEMLAGSRPFEARSTWELMQQHLAKPRPLLSSMASEVGSFFDEILIRAIAVHPSDRFQSVADFIKAIEGANEQAEQAEGIKIEQRNQVATMVEAAQLYLQRGSYDPIKAITMIEAALEVNPEDVNALRLKGLVHFEQEQFSESLESYKQAYEQAGQLSSEAGLDYLETLRKVAGFSWESEDHHAAVEYYHRIVEVLDKNGGEDERIQKIRELVWPRLFEFHRDEGDETYAQGNPQDLDKAIEDLEHHIQWLERLKADSEGLKFRRKSLQVKKSIDKIETEEENIENILSKVEDTPVEDEEIIQPYLNIDEYYQKLMRLEPENYDWKERRREKLKERAEKRRWLAKRAESRSDFEAAIHHYRAIGDIEQTAYPNVVKELGFDLENEIAELEKKADYASKYETIQELIAGREYQKALEHLEYEFILKGDYEYRDVARLLWRLLYSKRHDWEATPEWVSAFGKEPMEVWQTENNNQQKFAVLLKSSYTVLIVQILIIIVSVMIGITIGIIISQGFVN